MNVTFREAAPADLDAVVELARQLYEQDHIPFDEQVIRAALQRLIRDPAVGRLWVTDRAGAVAGYIVLTFGYSLEYGGRDAFVDELVIDAPHRGQGLGSAALRFATEACRALDVRALHLEVDRENGAAQRLYRRLGFEDHDRYLMTRPIAG